MQMQGLRTANLTLASQTNLLNAAPRSTTQASIFSQALHLRPCATVISGPQRTTKPSTLRHLTSRQPTRRSAVSQQHSETE
ncbi:hypothetical protein M3J09_010913 [Ascochyta lentis]